MNECKGSKRWIQLLAVGAVSTIGLGGCVTILGIEDTYVVEDAAPVVEAGDAGADVDAPVECTLTGEPRIAVVRCEDANGLEAVATAETFDSDNIAGEQIHLISLYRQRPTSGVSYVPVDFRYPGLNSLVLSAYEPTTWLVSLGDGGNLSKIYLADANQTLINPPAGVAVEMMQLSGVEACGYLPRASQQGKDCNTEAHMMRIEDYTARDVTSHTGCYQVTGVLIEPLCEASP